MPQDAAAAEAPNGFRFSPIPSDPIRCGAMGPGTRDPIPIPTHPNRTEPKLCAVFGPLSGSVLLGSGYLFIHGQGF